MLKTITEKSAKQTIKIYQSIAKANQAYRMASPAQRRVMIAEDALKQLKMGRIMATHGTYVGACNLADEAMLDADWNAEVQLQELLHNTELKSTCDVCARGALLLSAVRYRNDCTISGNGDLSDDSWIKEFSGSQQELIESAFEDYDEGLVWGEKFLSGTERNDPDKRLALILKNIIRNKGTFKPKER